MKFGPRRDKRGRLVCCCQGYPFPHRANGGACYNSPRADYYHALRQGLSESEARAMLSVNQLERMFLL